MKKDFLGKNLVVILLLIFIYPLGLILMWAIASWSKWTKWLISAPLLLAVILIIFAVAVNKLSPKNEQTNRPPGIINSLPNVNKYQTTQNQTKDNKIKDDFEILKQVLASYKQNNGNYPSSLEQLKSAGLITNLPIPPYSDRQYTYRLTNNNYNLSTTLGDGSTYQVSP